MNTLHIKMFGPFHVWRGGDAIDSLEELRTHKMAMQLLALLVLYQGRALSKSDAAMLLWGGGATESNLNKSIQALTKGLGADGWRISSVARTVRCEIDGLDVDLLALDRAWEQRSQTVGPLMTAINACEGSLLQGWDDPWVEEARTRYGARLRTALQSVVKSALATGQLTLADRYLQRLRLEGDCSESLHILLMKAWCAARSYPSAKQFYEEYRDFLRANHGLLPPEEMTLLYSQIPKLPAGFEPPVESQLVEVEAPGGAMPVHSQYYIERPVDRDFHTALARRDGTMLINGPRQVGKSSLLARGIEQAKQAGMQVVVSDFQRLDAASLESISTFYRCLLRQFHRKLALQVRPDDYWDENLSANENFEGYIQDVAIANSALPLLWCIDEADRIFDRDYRSSVFGLFRSWHNARAEGQDSAWSRFLLIMTYSTEAHLFIPDLHQSPFNIGTKMTLDDFTREQVAELNRLYDVPLSADELEPFYRLVGGHPFLVRLCLYEMKSHQLDLAGIESEAAQDFGLFRDHLERLGKAIAHDNDLSAGVRSLLRGDAGLSQLTFVRLRSAGIVAGSSTSSARLRCGLYERYFARNLS
jgi:DNA-binding SARP family transcriptional activator